MNDRTEQFSEIVFYILYMEEFLYLKWYSFRIQIMDYSGSVEIASLAQIIAVCYHRNCKVSSRIFNL